MKYRPKLWAQWQTVKRRSPVKLHKRHLAGGYVVIDVVQACGILVDHMLKVCSLR